MTRAHPGGKICVLERGWSGELRYVLRDPDWKPIYVNRKTMECVAVVYCEAPNGVHRACGTAFIVSTPDTVDQAAAMYAVTARHVIEGIHQGAPSELVRLRFNLADGNGSIPVDTLTGDWLFHPSDDQVDVAVLPLVLPAGVKYTHVETAMFATAAVIESESIGPGDETVMVGLYSRVPGADRNSPIMRVGNIAALLQEELQLNARWTHVRGHLVEVRSLNGTSGSPMFVPMSPLDQRPGPDGRGVRAGGKMPIYLFGLVQAHWDEQSQLTYDDRKVNEGIAVVTPADSILAVINQDALVAQRSNAKQRALSESSASMDTDIGP